MNGKTWRRRLGKLSFPDPVDAVGRVSLEEMMRRLSPLEREELAILRERIQDVGLAGLTDEEIDRLEALATTLQTSEFVAGRVTR